MKKRFIYVVESTFFYTENRIDYQGAHHAGDNHYFYDITSAEEFVEILIQEPSKWTSCIDGLFNGAYEQWKCEENGIRNYITIYKVELTTF